MTPTAARVIYPELPDPLTPGVTKDLTDRVKAGDLMREFAAGLGGKGGGKPDMAQGGGTDVKALPDVLKTVPAWVAAQLG